MNDGMNDHIQIRRERANGSAAGAKKPRATAKTAGSSNPKKKKTRSVASRGAFVAKLERHRSKILAVALSLFSILIFLALLSYTSYDEANATLSLSDFVGLLQGDDAIRARADTTQNWLGLLGAVIADFCYNYTIGFAALLFPVLCGVWAHRLYSNTLTQDLVSKTALAVILGSLFAAFCGTVQTVEWMPDLRPEWSGAIGQFTASVLTQLIGSVGSFLILITASIIALIVGLDIELETAIQRIKTLGRQMAQKISDGVTLPQRAASSGDDAEEFTENDDLSADDDTEEPARIIRRQSERQGAATGLVNILHRYDTKSADNQNAVTELNDMEPEDSAPPIESTPKTAPFIRRKTSTKRPPVDDALRRATAGERLNDMPAISEDPSELTMQTKPAHEPPRSRFDDTEAIRPEENRSERQIHPATDADPVHKLMEIDDAEPQPPAPKSLTVTVQEREEEEMVDDDPELTQHPLDEEIAYVGPNVDILAEEENEPTDVDEAELRENARILQEKLKTFKIDIEDLSVSPGPVVTQYEFVPAAGIKVSQIENLADDISLALKARGIRIIAPVPGRGTVAVEIPNHKPSIVRFSSIIRSPKFRDSNQILPLALGKTIVGDVFCDDLAKMPHLLIAGSTGSGKSVGINTIICSLLYKMHPRYLKLAIIDPKKIEMTQYRDIKNHFLAISPDIDETIVTNPQNAVALLKSVTAEMEQRYEILAKVGQRNIADYNTKVKQGKYKDTTDFVHREMPYIVVVIDELADLMMTASKEVEEPITRIAQLARAVGIHMIVATQRPSVDVITGIIKANFPARIAYQVASKIDSRTILDTSGAEHLLGNGDMLYLPGGAPKPLRLQNSFVSTEEVENICAHIDRQDGYSQPYELPSIESKSGGVSGGGASGDRDDLFNDAAHLVVRHQQGSVSLVQRRLKVGYSRAARIIDQLEDAGIVGPFDGSKARQVNLESEMELEAFL